MSLKVASLLVSALLIGDVRATIPWGDLFFMMPTGSHLCHTVTSKSQCYKAGSALVGNKSLKKSLQIGSWSTMPTGCTVDTAGSKNVYWNNMGYDKTTQIKSQYRTVCPKIHYEALPTAGWCRPWKGYVKTRHQTDKQCQELCDKMPKCRSWSNHHTKGCAKYPTKASHTSSSASFTKEGNQHGCYVPKRTKYQEFMRTYVPPKPTPKPIYNPLGHCVPEGNLLYKVWHQDEALVGNWNTKYQLLTQAWDECAQKLGCTKIMRGSDGYYYLRSASDKVIKKTGAYWFHFECPKHDMSDCVPNAETLKVVKNPGSLSCKNTGCLNDNQPQASLQKAWDLCAYTDGCTRVLKHSGKYYLRKDDDVETAGGKWDYWVEFKCPDDIIDGCGCPVGSGWCSSQGYCSQNCTTSDNEDFQCRDACGCARYTGMNDRGTSCQPFGTTSKAEEAACIEDGGVKGGRKLTDMDLCGCTGGEAYCPLIGKCGTGEGCKLPLTEQLMCSQKDDCGCQLGTGWCGDKQICDPACTTSAQEAKICISDGPRLGVQGAGFCPEGYRSPNVDDCGEIAHRLRNATADFAVDEWVFVPKLDMLNEEQNSQPLGCSISAVEGVNEIVFNAEPQSTNDGTWIPVCVPTALCYDGVQNGDEEGIDCGGSCPSCDAAPATCSDGILNNGEEMVDCGGPNCGANKGVSCRFCQDPCVDECSQCGFGIGQPVCGSNSVTYHSICQMEFFRHCAPRWNIPVDPFLHNVFNGSCADKPTDTATATNSATRTSTSTRTRTPTASVTPTQVRTHEMTQTATRTQTRTLTATQTLEPAPTCSDGMQNGNEVQVDCLGDCDAPCWKKHGDGWCRPWYRWGSWWTKAKDANGAVLYHISDAQCRKHCEAQASCTGYSNSGHCALYSRAVTSSSGKANTKGHACYEKITHEKFKADPKILA